MGKNPNVLVVDDDKNLRLMGGLLIPWGYEVTLARNGKEALKKAKETRPDIVLLDIMMPKMDGFKVAKQLKETDETRIIPIVMVTALSDVEARVRAIERLS